jgi:hypothetical protein
MMVAILLSSFSAALATDVGPGNVTGTWTAGGSPYIVQGHLTVPSLQQLTIEPGVDVRFNGPYVLKVIGILMAQGTAVDSIFFRPHTGRSDWGHIELVSDQWLPHQFQYCRISNGNASQLASPYIKNGGGIYSNANSQLLMDNCVVEDCQAEEGGGVYLSETSNIGWSVVRRCVADGINGEGGGILALGGSNIRYCEIYENVAEFLGGGISANSFTGDIEANYVRHNHVMEGHGGGIAMFIMDGAIRFNHIWSNSVAEPWSDGGGIFLWYGTGTIHNNTIVDNEADLGSGIAFGNAGSEINRNIIAFNRGDASADVDPCPVTFDYNCSYGNTGSDLLDGTHTNTIMEHPLFCDYGAGVFSLCADSPCLPDGIGAQGQGCGNCWPTTESVTWSQVKALY